MAKENFTAARVEAYICDAQKQQTIHLDAKTPGLGVRVSRAGARSFVFESRLNGATVRMTIGDTHTWVLSSARAEANRLKSLIDQGKDPREIKLQERAAHTAKISNQTALSVTVGEAWRTYLEDRQSRWGERHYQDHVKKAQAGGVPAVRGTRGRGVTVAGPLFPLMTYRLCDLRSHVLEAWATREAASRSTSARLSWRLLKGFFSWCSEQDAFSSVVVGNPANTKKIRELLGSPGVKKDVLQREQLEVWFAAVQQLANPITAAYLQTLLLTGARPSEVLGLKWANVNLRWKALTINDKVEGDRTIPLTPFVKHLISNLPRRSEWVFPGAISASDKTPKPMSKPHQMHDRACDVAGIDELTLHGLRRSFKSLTEWLDCPAGVVAQIMGHKPSATAEKHYTVRPLDLLRLHHERIEAWMLDQANIKFSSDSPTTYLRLATRT